mgnify:CR=1 FL=1
MVSPYGTITVATKYSPERYVSENIFKKFITKSQEVVVFRSTSVTTKERNTFKFVSSDWPKR